MSNSSFKGDILYLYIPSLDILLDCLREGHNITVHRLPLLLGSAYLTYFLLLICFVLFCTQSKQFIGRLLVDWSVRLLQQ